MSVDYSIDELDTFDDSKLKQLDWKSLQRLNGRLLELHGEGALGNEKFAKLPLRPILCIDRIDTIDEKTIEASFTFPTNAADWRFDPAEPLEMLFQDQLDQLVGFWGCRKADGIGRALSSGACKLHQSLDFEPGKKIIFRLDKRKWVKNKDSEGGTAVFNGSILNDSDDVLLETKNVIVGILSPEAIQALRKQFGGMQGVSSEKPADSVTDLHIPIYEPATIIKEGRTTDGIQRVTATQAIDQNLWPLRFHFRGDPVVPGNFGTHGMIALLKNVAMSEFELDYPIFRSLANKRFSGMIFEDPKQIRFELINVTRDLQNQVIAEEANLYLEKTGGEKMIEEPIYTFKNMTVAERGS
jgi:3-hydroxymyristoyl/3-hydroxydecanoyl-(acyl carrier protein) dehydratase